MADLSMMLRVAKPVGFQKARIESRDRETGLPSLRVDAKALGGPGHQPYSVWI